MELKHERTFSSRFPKQHIRRYDNGTETGGGFYPHYKLRAEYLPVREDPTELRLLAESHDVQIPEHFVNYFEQVY